jgi:hypothetical protein
VLHKRRRGGSRADIVAKDEMRSREWFIEEIWWLRRKFDGSCADVVTHGEMLWLRRKFDGSCADVVAREEMLWLRRKFDGSCADVVAREEM